jgi:glycolate oxidase FAD binding subunit
MALDVAWQAGRGAVMARAGGTAARDTAQAAAAALSQAGLDVNLHPDDDGLWAAQRAAQRAGPGATVVRVSGRASQLAAVIEAADAEGARLVGRAALGLSWLALPALEAPEAIAAVGRVRSRLSPSPCVVQEAPEAVRRGLDPWDLPEGPELALMRRLCARFDPGAVCNRGLLIEAA